MVKEGKTQRNCVAERPTGTLLLILNTYINNRQAYETFNVLFLKEYMTQSIRKAK